MRAAEEEVGPRLSKPDALEEQLEDGGRTAPAHASAPDTGVNPREQADGIGDGKVAAEIGVAVVEFLRHVEEDILCVPDFDALVPGDLRTDDIERYVSAG